MRTAPLLLLALACSSDEPVDTTPTDDPWVAPEAGVITVTTRDDLDLEADYQPAPVEGAPAVILLHMIPPNATRADWPLPFRDTLHDRGWTVLNLDRRGAGGSEGDPVQAYTGETGRYDVEAAALRIAEDGYGPIAILGASNGTTSMVDYAAWAASQELPEPVALAYLSGGSYTTAQTPIAEVPGVPAAFLYPPSEADWAEAQRVHDPGTWSFTAYEGGAHGTRLFTTTARQQVIDDLESFLAGVFE